MNLGNGSLIPQANGVINNEHPWIPVTPEKPVIRATKRVPVDKQGSLTKGTNWQEQLGNQSQFSLEKPIMQTTYPIDGEMQGDQIEGNNWIELLGLYSGVLQEKPKNDALKNFNGAGLLGHGEHNLQDGAAGQANGCFNQNAGFYRQNIAKDVPIGDNTSWTEILGIKNAPAILPIDGTPSTSTHGMAKPSFTISYPHIENQRTRYQSVGSVLLHQESALHPNQGFMSSSLPKMPSDGFPVPRRPVYNLNSPPRAETAEVLCTASCFQFAPVTPDQGKQLKNHQQSDITNFSVDECLQQRKDKLDIISTNSQLGNHCDELLHSVIASPMASDLTTLKEKNISEDGGHGGIDLNKTPLQRPPKRKKHRPKVVVEGKPKRTPKPTASKANISSENPSGKRKYVRRKGLEASTSAKQNERNGIEASGVSSTAKSCRRVLNFDVEDKRYNSSENWIGDNQAEAHLKRKPFDLNLHCQDTTCSTGFNTRSDISSTKEGQQDGHNAEKQHGKRKNDLVHSNNQKRAEKSLLLAPTAPPPTARDHTLNVIARSLNLQNAACQNNDQSGYSQGNQHILGDDIGRTILQANTASAKFDAARKLMAQTLCTSVKETAEIYEKRGSKRDYCRISVLKNPQSVDLMHSQFLSQETSNTSEQKKDSSQNGIGTLEAHKRKKIEDKCHGVASSISSSVSSVQDCLRQVESRGCNYIHASSSSSCLFGRLPVSNLEMQNTIGKQSNQIANDRCDTNTAAGNGFHEKKSSSRAYLRLWQVGPKFQENSETNSLNVIAGTTDSLLPSTPGVSAFAPGNETSTSLVDFSVKRQNVLTASSIQACRKEKVHPEENKKEKRSQRSSRKAKGQKEEQKCQVTVEEITYQLQGLEIGNGGKEVAAKEQNAIVPYKGDGAIVTYDGFDPMKRRRPRPKVDLDPETNRLWNLLMGNARSESTETMDMDREKWWEEERKVVRGRVDSFIARMHLVQGDRRFSQWKGSVVDSVIGVFLTQNVSDHLSSSAFMSLAAKFPLPLTTFNTNCCQNGAITWIEEPESQIIDPDGTVTYPEIMLRQPLYKQNSMTLSESTERRSDNLISETLSHLVNDSTSGTEEEVVSSQNSSDSFRQAPEDVRSSSESEVEDRIIMSNSNNCSSETIPKTERTAMFKLYQRYAMTSPFLDKSSIPKYLQQENPQRIRQNSTSIDGRNAHAYPVISDVACLQGSLSPSELWLNKTSDIGVHAPCCYGSLGHKSMSSFLHRSVEITTNSGAGHSPKEIGGVQGSANSLTTQESGMPTNHTITTGQPVYQKQHPEDNLRLGSHFGSNQQSISSNRLERSKSFDLEGRSVIEPKRPDEAHAKLQNGHLCSSGEQFSNADTNIPKARKKKNEVDKTKAFDWDSLRKKVLAKGGKKERSKDNMDSLDYEALRHADVNKISATIKERGMNNMLAERIKDFLNRLVTEHGSIDLEWLRDVPADQAKDYLLSIRGLGLKSVECVRLLTLHQIAFPVDTNVGRIAVRLGWVPLQTLPESLQLHLLELYPVLESIQKYLWPRLCKLDQRTLYELHYQMITFGKVFCTKSKPNCNACPLRAECRHFASAFASSRLALPGPEERSIVSSTTSVASGSAPVIVKPMPLPPAETSEGWESQYIRANCEPIIEEPTTPEPYKEASETDIEDMFYDDPDEIPTIKLSFEELKMNVESIMQEQNVEIQPNDLSRALVALDPSVASIPAPKLKSVSRLRTEHLVYELPDSHPLLKGMDRRERDDPCPYLLVLWNPGETASTSQSIEGRCSLQASDRLCSSIKEETNSQTVRGTFLIPCRTAMRGSFPLNGTYFQVNEMFADHESSENPIDVPRDWLWQLPRRTVYFGTSVTSIFRGLSTDEIMYCFWKGFVCVRGFDKKSRAPRPLNPRLHEAASKMTKNKNKVK